VQAARIDPAFLLRKSGLPPTLFSSGDGVLSTEQLFRLWHTLGELSDDPTVGLKLATLNPWSHPANIAAQHARTFGDGLRHLVRYCTILCWFDHMRIVKSENECIIEFTGPLLNGAAPTILPEHAFARALEIGWRGTQRPLYPLRVELTRTASHQEIYEAHYGSLVSGMFFMFFSYIEILGFRGVPISIAAPVYMRSLKELRVAHILVAIASILFLLIPAVAAFYPIPATPADKFPLYFGA